ncbi:MAG: tetratricopeptide repeat protein [Pirellulaceae bacterium]|nr:tetratricopeptide repeat protein [Pirellulaceae bacterium]
MRRLVVLDITGPASMRATAQQVIVDGIARSGAYEIASERDLLPAAPARLRFENGSANMPAILAAARRIGAETVLAGRLRIEASGQSLGSVTVRVGDPRIVAAIQYKLLDVRTGRVIDQNSVESFYEGELQTTGSGPTSRSQVFARLTKESAALVVASLAPHEAPVEVELASQAWGPGAAELKLGNRAARNGNWDEAMKQWNNAVLVNQENDLAWYNLGLAHEAKGAFRRAHDAYQRAAALKQDERYLAALERLNVAAEGFQVALAQRSRRIPTGRVPPARHQHPIRSSYVAPAAGPNTTASATHPTAGRRLPPRQGPMPLERGAVGLPQDTVRH